MRAAKQKLALGTGVQIPTNTFAVVGHLAGGAGEFWESSRIWRRASAAFTEAAGMKAALSNYLGFPQALVSEWLAEKYRPSGEVTLKLMHWVSDPRERQK
jgi:hypothetical protein